MNNNSLKEIDRKCFKLFRKMKVIELYENVDLNAVSFIVPLTRWYYNYDKVEKYGSLSKWYKFLKQFPQLGK